MSEFDKYLQNLAKHEQQKSKQISTNPRDIILVNSGIRLNWIGEYLSNPEIKWIKKSIKIQNIEFTGTNLEWNKILIDQCNRDPLKFLKLVNENPQIKERFLSESSFNYEYPILLRKSEVENKFKVLDGMHRFVGAVINGYESIDAYIPENEEILPYCEPHVIYDLIKGFMRNANDSEGEIELYYSLKLLIRTYANVKELLINRFDIRLVSDEKVQEIIKKVLNS